MQEVNEKDILCFCETWLKSTELGRIRFNNDYLVLHSAAEKDAVRSRAKGGILIALCKSYFSAKLLFSAREYIVVLVSTGGFSFVLCTVYLSPSVDIDCFYRMFYSLLIVSDYLTP